MQLVKSVAPVPELLTSLKKVLRLQDPLARTHPLITGVDDEAQVPPLDQIVRALVHGPAQELVNFCESVLESPVSQHQWIRCENAHLECVFRSQISCEDFRDLGVVFLDSSDIGFRDSVLGRAQP